MAPGGLIVTGAELVAVGISAVAVGFLGLLLAFWGWDDKDERQKEDEDR
ncbi:MAG: hypothetical protein M0005_10350 [Actinomycetota bacterium]|jgi:hypothetical protein|nr:hypothetical protein [Actinomycetota bacterium]